MAISYAESESGKAYIGIDPGKSGGIAVIQGGAVLVSPYSDGELLRLARELQGTEAVCCLEKVGAMPKQGVASTFLFGQEFGYIMGVLEAFGIPYQLEPPRVWKKEYHLGSDKAESVKTCKRLFPEVDLKRTPRCRTEHDGMAEALLMAEYAKRRYH